jgi:hypothetical protein
MSVATSSNETALTICVLSTKSPVLLGIWGRTSTGIESSIGRASSVPAPRIPTLDDTVSVPLGDELNAREQLWLMGRTLPEWRVREEAEGLTRHAELKWLQGELEAGGEREHKADRRLRGMLDSGDDR